MAETKKQVPQRGTRLKTGSTTEQDVSAADKAAAETIPEGTTTGGGGKMGVTGVPKGTNVYVGEQERYESGGRVVREPVYRQTQYAVGDGMSSLLNLDNPGRVALLQQVLVS